MTDQRAELVLHALDHAFPLKALGLSGTPSGVGFRRWQARRRPDRLVIVETASRSLGRIAANIAQFRLAMRYQDVLCVSGLVRSANPHTNSWPIRISIIQSGGTKSSLSTRNNMRTATSVMVR